MPLRRPGSTSGAVELRTAFAGEGCAPSVQPEPALRLGSRLRERQMSHARQPAQNARIYVFPTIVALAFLEADVSAPLFPWMLCYDPLEEDNYR
jgi:hypothetical protein